MKRWSGGTGRGIESYIRRIEKTIYIVNLVLQSRRVEGGTRWRESTKGTKLLVSTWRECMRLRSSDHRKLRLKVCRSQKCRRL